MIRVSAICAPEEGKIAFDVLSHSRFGSPMSRPGTSVPRTASNEYVLADTSSEQVRSPKAPAVSGEMSH